MLFDFPAVNFLRGVSLQQEKLVGGFNPLEKY